MKKRKKYSISNKTSDQGIYGINAKKSKIPKRQVSGSDISNKVKSIIIK